MDEIFHHDKTYIIRNKTLNYFPSLYYNCKMKTLNNSFLLPTKFLPLVLIILLSFYKNENTFSQNDKLLRISQPQLYLDLLNEKGYMSCGVILRPGCCVEGSFPDEVMSFLNPAHVEEIKIPTSFKAKSLYDACEKMAFPEVQNFQLGSMAGFYRLAEVDTQMARMHQMFPQYVSQRFTVPGISSHQGRPLAYYRISDNPFLNENEPAIFYGAAIHAREPVSVSNLIYFLWYLLENAAYRPDLQYILNHAEIYVMPMINPDGYYYNEITNPNGGGNWRKNMRNNGDGSIGVDLNRNFPYAWGWDDLGSSPDPASFTYRGPYPASEPEVQAVMWLAQQEKFHYSLMHHSYGNFLIHPWNYQDAQCPDAVRFKASATLATSDNGYLAGTCAETVGYLANGGSDDYLYADTSGGKNSILAMTPETGSYYDGFWPLEERIVTLCRRDLWLNLAPLYVLFPTLQHDLKPPLLLASGMTHNLPFRWQRYSDSNAVFVRTFTSLSPYLSIPPSGAVRTFSNPAYQTMQADTLHLQVSPDAPQGHAARVVLSWNNGLYSRYDTLSFYLGTPDTVLFTSCDPASTVTFTSTGWGYDFQTYVSPPAALSDSPGADYSPDANNEIWFDKIISLSDALAAELSFFARWETEKSYDFVVPLARLLTGEEIPLCGRHTCPLFSYPSWGSLQEWPVYSGEQVAWVKEYISLEPLLGQKFQIGFRFSADNYIEADGFFVDDVCVKKLTPSLSAALSDNNSNTPFSVFPNPASHFIKIKFQESMFEKSVDIYGSDSRRIRSFYISPGIHELTFPVEEIPAGVYTLRCGDTCHKLVLTP